MSNVKLLEVVTTIRLATREDAPAVRNLLEQLGYEAELPGIERALAEGFGHAEARVFVYELSNQNIAGFVSIVRLFYFPELRNITRITAICINERYRSCGIGTQLLDFVESLATQNGDAAIEVTCSMRRARAHHFYLQHGYAQHSYKFVKPLLASS